MDPESGVSLTVFGYVFSTYSIAVSTSRLPFVTWQQLQRLDTDSDTEVFALKTTRTQA